MVRPSQFDPTIGVNDPTTPAAPVERRAELERGAHLDRYVILKLLGKGGMGAVYAAHDPKLDRQVAIKLLHAQAASEEVVREAQALARLDDPHVVQVYDAGEVDGQVFIAMQLVDGEDLATALRRRSPTVAHVIQWYLAAGRGLAAAHAAGLVHRDFKPNNVLIDRRGRALVTDFGLARDLGERGQTGLGMFMGTPAYMSPEQHGSMPATEASDQFSFCVAMWESLFGQHPFVVGDRGAMSPFAIGFAIYDGPLIAPPRGHRVSRKVIEALTRGLARDPAQRWPNMAALLEQLTPSDKRRVWPYIAIAGAVAAAAGGAAMWLVTRHAAGDSCGAEAAQRADAAWSPALAQQIHDRFASTGRSYADAATRQVRAGLDRYATRWQALASDVCTAEHAAHGPAPELVVRRRACLDARLDALRALGALLTGETHPEFVDHAGEMVSALPELGDCSDEAGLLAAPDLPPPAQAPAIAQLELELANGTARGVAGDYQRAVTDLTSVAQRADALGWTPLIARAHLALGRAQAAMLEPAHDELVEAGTMATEHHLDRDAARAWTALLLDDGTERKPEAIAAMLPVARSSAARTGDRPLEVAVDIAYGRALARTHQLGEAATTCRAAIAEAQALDRSDELGHARDCLLEALVPSGAYAEVEPLLAQLIADNTRLLGAEHPAVSDYLQVKVTIEVRQGKLAEARADAERVLAIRRRVYPPHHFKIAEILNELGDIARAENKAQEAKQHWTEALAIAVDVKPEPLTLIADIHQELGFLAEADDDHATARQHFEQAIDLMRKRGADGELELAFLLLNYGQVKSQTDLPGGIAMLEEAKGILEKHHDKRASAVGGALTVIYVTHKKWPEARAAAEDALAHTDADTDPHHRALIEWMLAQSIAETHGDRKRARELATSARAGFAKLGPAEAATVQAVDAWLASHH